MAKTLIITTPSNPEYGGETLGVKFSEGQAIVSPHGKPHKLGYTIEQLDQKFRTELQGYETQIIDDSELKVEGGAVVVEGRKKVKE